MFQSHLRLCGIHRDWRGHSQRCGIFTETRGIQELPLVSPETKRHSHRLGVFHECCLVPPRLRAFTDNEGVCQCSQSQLTLGGVHRNWKGYSQNGGLSDQLAFLNASLSYSATWYLSYILSANETGNIHRLGGLHKCTHFDLTVRGFTETGGIYEQPWSHLARFYFIKVLYANE